MFKLSERSKNNRADVDPRLIEISDLAIKISVVDFGHGSDSGLRTADRQRELFDQGRSKADGTERRSRHQSGKALDFYAYVNGKASWDHAHLAIVAVAFLQSAAMLGYSLKWGGLWKSENSRIINGVPYGWDMPHVQLVD